MAVLRSLANGLRAVDIARETGRSVSTVNTFVQRIKTKLGLRTVVEIVHYADDNRLLG
jgi:DNA-binding NarL/FixJ family response regulator